MEKEHFLLMAKYNKETNVKMNNIIKNLSEDDWNKQFSGHYKSIHELCSHIYIGDCTWLNRFRTLNEYISLVDNKFYKNINLYETLFESIPEYLEKRIELDAFIIKIIEELEENDLKKILKWTNSKGITFEKKLGVCLLHLSHHQAHHRGMISLYLEFIGKDNDFSNLYPYG